MKQVKSKNKNRMADETLNDSLRAANVSNMPVTLVLIKERVSEKPQPQASHW